MAKTKKPIEKRRKGFKRRGVFYCVMIVLLAIATILLSINGVKEVLNKAFFPTSRIVMIEGEEREVFSELSKDEAEIDEGVTKEIDVSAYYYLDETGEKVYLSPYYKLNKIATLQTGFKSDAVTRVSVLRAAVVGLLVLFILLFLIYLLRLSFFLSNEDAEWSRQLREKRLSVSVFFDKLATRFSKLNKAGKKDDDSEAVSTEE